MWVDDKYYSDEDVEAIEKKYRPSTKVKGGYQIFIDTAVHCCEVKQPDGSVVGFNDTKAFITYYPDGKTVISVEIEL